jgi:hypothetical protein
MAGQYRRKRWVFVKCKDLVTVLSTTNKTHIAHNIKIPALYLREAYTSSRLTEVLHAFSPSFWQIPEYSLK